MTNTAVTTPPAAAKVWDRESLIALLNTNNYAVERALLTIYARQTADEQETETTSHNNGVGFSGFDAEIFSSFAVQVEQSTRPNGQRLSPKQFAIARKPGKGGTPRIGRYAKQ